MRYWRISTFPDVSGRGGLLASGRWHRAGRPVVYLSESPAAAMLEVLVHQEIDSEDVPNNLKLLRVELPDNATLTTVSDLSDHWQNRIEETRNLGDSWLNQGDTLLLAVPSAVVPHTTNFLFNPLHSQAEQASVTVERLRLDRRLLKGK